MTNAHLVRLQDKIGKPQLNAFQLCLAGIDTDELIIPGPSCNKKVKKAKASAACNAIIAEER